MWHSVEWCGSGETDDEHDSTLLSCMGVGYVVSSIQMKVRTKGAAAREIAPSFAPN